MTWLDSLQLKWEAWRLRREADSLSGRTTQGTGPVAPQGSRRRFGWMLLPLGVLLILPLYYGIGGALTHKIDEALDFRPSPADLPAGGSVTVGMVAAVMAREIDYGWTPNDPWFYPTAWLDNMPAFQRGLVSGSRQVVLEMRDHVGRTRGSGQTDASLELAYSTLSYPPDYWWMGTQWPFLRASSETSYREAIDALRTYNDRLSRKDALFERRSDSLYAALDRVALGLGAASATLDKQVSTHSKGWFDSKADDRFYEVKGQAYASYLILAGLREDYAVLLRQRELQNIWAEMMRSLQELIAIDPLYVSNGEPGGLLIKNHLTEQGFYLLRVRTQLREITSVLEK
jgi:Uncharacterized protein conserved in bacteria (DUF2333)